MYPTDPVDIGNQISVLPEDGTVPGLKGWRYVHSPGHTPGHISLFREEDRLLIAGDAFVTTKSESAVAVMLQTKKISRPPAYFTSDWQTAYISVKQLCDLSPDIVATGHGQPITGEEAREGLAYLYQHFAEEMPLNGRYVDEPAVADANGLLYTPPRKAGNNAWMIAAVAAAVLTAVTLSLVLRKRRRSPLHF
jgi:glyoxylase-like metal-dependent hydrolase (beta-lactamase superfamily II)